VIWIVRSRGASLRRRGGGGGKPPLRAGPVPTVGARKNLENQLSHYSLLILVSKIIVRRGATRILLREGLVNVKILWHIFGDFEVLLRHSQLFKPYIAQIMLFQIIETLKRSKLSDILSCLLTLTCLREGLQPPPWLRPWSYE